MRMPPKLHKKFGFTRYPSVARTVALYCLVPGLIALCAQPAHAQSFQVIHSFSGTDGGNPAAGLTIDRAGNLYGTTEYGGTHTCDSQGHIGCGSIFKLSRHGASWILGSLYDFTGGSDKAYPEARVVFGPDGALYGTTSIGGGLGGDGAVYKLQPPTSACKSVSCPWTETVLFQFDFSTGSLPSGDLAFDAAGNIYGTTRAGGSSQCAGGQGCGVAYQLTHSGGVWAENILFTFLDGTEGREPDGGVILDRAGNVYGTTCTDNQTQAGLVFELTPSGAGWTENVLYFLEGSGAEHPCAGLISDPAGNLYGATEGGGSHHVGAVFRLTPSGSDWNFSLLASILGGQGQSGPSQSLVMDSAGNLYGASLIAGAHGYGSIFKVSPSNGSWTYTSLYDFTGGADGGNPNGNLVLDANGNIYGTTSYGGQSELGCSGSCGVIWMLTQ